MNSISISGIIGRDAEIRHLPDGTPVAAFSIADSQGKDKTLWWNCSLFGKRAESLSTYLVKGQPLTVIGNVTEESWTDKQSGQERKSMKVRVNEVALQGRKPDEAQRQAPKPQQQAIPDDDQDIPF